MSTPESAREYLETALKGVPGGLKAASAAAGKNHAYLQQYTKRGKPVWLPEPVREALVSKYRLDPDRLRPPAASATRPAQAKQPAQIDAPLLAQLLNDANTLELLGVWAAMSNDRRALALRIVHNLAADSSKVA